MNTDPAEPVEAPELRLALAALLGAVAGLGPLHCARTLDEATRRASHAPRRLLAAVGAPSAASIVARFEAARALDSLCAACGECPRGAPPKAREPVMAAGFPPETPH